MADKERLEIEHTAPSRNAITKESVRESIRRALEDDEFVSKLRDALVKSDQVAVTNKHELGGPTPRHVPKRPHGEKK